MENENNEDFAYAKSSNCPPHPTRFARHLPRHGKANRLASADNRGEDNKAILFLFFYTAYYTVISIILLYRLAEYVALLNYCLSDDDNLLKMLHN